MPRDLDRGMRISRIFRPHHLGLYPPYFVEPQMTTTTEMDRRMDQG